MAAKKQVEDEAQTLPGPDDVRPDVTPDVVPLASDEAGPDSPKPPEDPKAPAGRALAQSVYFTDDEGRLTIYERGDVPAPEHASKIGEHAYAPPPATPGVHPHGEAIDLAPPAKVTLAVMEAS